MAEAFRPGHRSIFDVGFGPGDFGHQAGLPAGGRVEGEAG